MRLMKANVFTSPELIEASVKNLQKYDYLNAYVSYRDTDLMFKEAEAAQVRIEKSK